MNKYFKNTKKACHNEGWWPNNFISSIKYIDDLILCKETKAKPFAVYANMIVSKYRKQVFEFIYDNGGQSMTLLQQLEQMSNQRTKSIVASM